MLAVRACAGAAGGGIFIGLGAYVLPGQWRFTAVLAGVTLQLAAAAVLAYAAVRGYKMDKAERQAGYTTTYRQHAKYWQLDWETGDVLRRPGERRAAHRGGRNGAAR